MAQTAPNHDRACRVARVGLGHEVSPHAQQLTLTVRPQPDPARKMFIACVSKVVQRSCRRNVKYFMRAIVCVKAANMVAGRIDMYNARQLT